MNKILVLLSFILMGFRVEASYVNDEYITSLVFPADYHIGDFMEFVKASPINAGAAGYYEISISYTRSGVAAASTYLASISHANPSIWREVGKINGNGYVYEGFSFTVDCNTEYTNPRFRVRAIATLGATNEPISVNIKIRSININGNWTSLNNAGNDLTVNKFVPMTNNWALYVGNCINPDGANIAIKAVENGNVGIGTDTPNEKLSVNGKIRAREVKVENVNWPDFVFSNSYGLLSLEDIEKHIKENGHLPGIPSALEVKTAGIDLGDMNAKLLQKIEELTLHLIDKEKQLLQQQLTINQQELRLKKIEKLLKL